MVKTALFAGSFDPMTNGHVDVLTGALAVADRVVLAVAVNADKRALFSFEERAAMLREVAASLSPDLAGRVEVIAHAGLVVDAARAAGATLLIRGLRDGGDADAEMRMAAMNAALAPDIRTVLLPAAPQNRHISATLVRQIADMGGDVSAFVPAAVARQLLARGRR